MMKRRSVLAHSASLAALATLPPAALAQGRKDSMVLAMTLEPSPGLDPTGGAASSIAEITHYNIFETLTKINPYFGIFAAQLKTARPRTPSPNWPQIDSVLGNAVASALKGQPTKAALDDAAQQIDELLKS